MFGQGWTIRTFITLEVTPQCNTLRDYNSLAILYTNKAEKAAVFGDVAKQKFGTCCKITSPRCMEGGLMELKVPCL